MTWTVIEELAAVFTLLGVAIGISWKLAQALKKAYEAIVAVQAFFLRLESKMDTVISTHVNFTQVVEHLIEGRR